MNPFDAWIAVVLTPWVIGPTVAMHFWIGTVALVAVQDPDGDKLPSIGL